MPPLLPGERPPWLSNREIELVAAQNRDIAEMMEQKKLYDYDIIQHDNRSESYRNHEEGSLLVSREPQVIRPREDTGVRYGIDESEQALQVSLENAVKKPEYEWNSLKLKTGHKLCQACVDVLNYYCRYVEERIEYNKQPKEKRPSRFGLSNSVVHHFNIFSLYIWASIDQCYWCQKLLEQIENRYGDALNPGNWEDFRTEVCWKQNIKLEEEDTLYFIITNPSLPKDNWNSIHFYRMKLWPDGSFPRHFEQSGEDNTGDISKLSLERTTNTGSSKSRALSISWLSQCRANEEGKHQECNRRDQSFLPTRLLDIKHAQKTSQLRLVSPGLTPERFLTDREWITLSHCWGAWGAKENPILTQTNFLERQETGLLIADLPKTFQDAIEIVSWFNVSWIWIDCLCIIQDSSPDWLYEASKMSEIYQNALLNISADSGIDSRAGCFVARDPLSITPLSISAPQLKRTWQALPVATHLFAWTSKTPSFSRAWIHRERQLARRVLHFTETEIVWECCGTGGTSFASEMLPSGAPFKHDLFGQDPKYQIGRLQQGLIEGEEESYASWNDICERMSEKMLTKPEDMPIVLAGLAKDFSHVLPGDEYVAGLWREMLPLGLLWCTRRFKANDLGYIAPSWSWLSTDCAVTLANRSAIKSKNALVDILDIKTELKYDDAFGSVEKGTLELEGVVRKIRVSFNEETGLFTLSVLDHEADEEMRYIGPSWEPYEGDLCKLELDSQVKTLDLECFCLFVTIQQWSDRSSDRDISCLLLQLSGEGESVFKRIGMLVLKDLMALKMRYRPVEKVEEEKWVEMQGVVCGVQDDIIRERREKERRDKDEKVEDIQDDEKQDDDEDNHDDAAINEGAEGMKIKVKEEDAEADALEQDIDEEDDVEYDEGIVSPKHSISERSQYLEALYQFDGPIAWNDCLKELSPQTLFII